MVAARAEKKRHATESVYQKKTACKHIHSEEVGMEREYCLSRNNIAKHNLPYIWLEITA
jgi:hypothetical protein